MLTGATLLRSVGLCTPDLLPGSVGNVCQSMICSSCSGVAGALAAASGIATGVWSGLRPSDSPWAGVPQMRVTPMSDATASRFVVGSQLTPTIVQPKP